MDGDELRALRVRKGWTQSQLATSLKITPQYVGMLERGTKEIQPHVEKVARSQLSEFADRFTYVPDGPAYREAQRALVTALKKEPTLSLNGFPYAYEDDPFDVAKSDQESRARLFSDDSLAQIATAIAWIDAVKVTGKPRAGSYGAKHAAEKWGRENGYAPYVANGALLVAALFRKVPYKRVPKSPNAQLGIDTNPMPVPKPGSFAAWLREQIKKSSPLGDLARDAAEDRTFPVNTSSGPRLRSYLRSKNASYGAMDALEEALTLWRTGRRRSKLAYSEPSRPDRM